MMAKFDGKTGDLFPDDDKPQVNSMEELDNLPLADNPPLANRDFKVGDWVYDNHKNRLFQWTTSHNLVDAYTVECIEHWQPKEGEWVVYTDIVDENYSVFKYCEKSHEPYKELTLAPLEFIQTLERF